MGRNERWKCHLECHLMSSDYEDDDQYTPTIDDKLTQGKISMGSCQQTTRNARLDALMCPMAALLKA
jgi:hypothetical protein